VIEVYGTEFWFSNLISSLTSLWSILSTTLCWSWHSYTILHPILLLLLILGKYFRSILRPDWSDRAQDYKDLNWIGLFGLNVRFRCLICWEPWTQDTWGNIKIPRIERLTSSIPQFDKWYTVLKENVSYSSLVGVPVKGIPEGGNSSFVIQASYFSLKCPKGPKWVATKDEIVWSNTNHITSQSTGSGIGWYVKGSKQDVIGTGSSRYYRDSTWVSTFSIGSFGPLQTRKQKNVEKPMSIYFQSGTDSLSLDVMSITGLNCALTATYVNNKVNCEGRNCSISSVKLTPGSVSPDYATPLANEDLAW
jgi:hypothetical protein